MRPERGQDGWRGGMRTKGSKEGGGRIMRQKEKDEEEDCSIGCELLWKSRLSKWKCNPRLSDSDGGELQFHLGIGK